MTVKVLASMLKDEVHVTLTFRSGKVLGRFTKDQLESKELSYLGDVPIIGMPRVGTMTLNLDVAGYKKLLANFNNTKDLDASASQEVQPKKVVIDIPKKEEN